MSLTPFNNVESLVSFTSFRQGAGGPTDSGDLLKQSAIEATFSLTQLQNELQRARDYIGKRTASLSNDDFTDARKDELTESELYLATSRLYERYAEKIASKFPESNLAGVGEVTQGADTPDPLTKMETWHRVSRIYLERGLHLLYGQPWDIEVGNIPTASDHYPCLGNGCNIYSNNNRGCCGFI